MQGLRRPTSHCYLLVMAHIISAISGTASIALHITLNNVPIGHGAEMSCSVNASLKIIEWRKDLTLIPFSSSHYKFNAEKSALVISKLLAADKGTYQCVAVSASNNRVQSNIVTLNVLVKPTIVPMSATVREGDPARVGCYGRDFTYVYWSKNGHNVFNKPGYQHSGDSHEYLDIVRASPADAGTYNCTAVNDYLILGATAFPTLTVEYAPVIAQGPRGKTVVKGYEVHLFCNATGVPRPRIYWKKDGVFVEALSERFEVGYVEGTLFIETAEFSDAGLYSCFANNSVNPAGTESKAAQLNIIDVKKFYKENAYKTVQYGANETIWCSSNHSISDQIVWYKSGKELKTMNQLVVGSEGQLHIFQATYNISDVYECNFKGQPLPLGIKLFQRVFVTVRGPPSPPRLIDAILTTVNESSLIVSLNWTEPFDGNSPINKYTICVGRKQGNLLGQIYSANGLARSAVLILDLLTFGATSFLCSIYIVAHNAHGKSSKSNVVTRQLIRSTKKTDLPTYVNVSTTANTTTFSASVSPNVSSTVPKTALTGVLTENTILHDDDHIMLSCLIVIVGIVPLVLVFFVWKRKKKSLKYNPSSDKAERQFDVVVNCGKDRFLKEREIIDWSVPRGENTTEIRKTFTSSSPGSSTVSESNV
ncbi:neuronal cell adhesion molecule-like isoform X5 [Oscarella lobularis]|uniref:neuronal cell adhesion molecule-like isoform X5 n=1 Tax=Oscarella lobularis TaxID=121494 RepID=UPI0033132F98